MRKILYLNWDCFCEEYICDSFQRAGLLVEQFALPYGKVNMRWDESFEQLFKNKLQEAQWEFVFSFNFFPLVSRVCYEQNITYVSWTYDSPFMYLYAKEVCYPTNRVYVFDSDTVMELTNKGVPTVQYLPMAAPVAFYDGMYSGRQIREKFQTDLSFVGSMYNENRQSFMKYLNGMKPETANYIEVLIQLQRQSFALPILEKMLKPEIIDDLQRVCPIALEEGEMQSLEWMYANYFLAREVTARERVDALHRLSQLCSVKLYTPEATDYLERVENLGPVDYCNEMPYVFKNSKINLNISLHSIYSGIPLRAFDIMGCNGFLLTDYQKDFAALFQADEDYVYFTNLDDMVNKAVYYLENEDKRKRIAQNGYEKVKACHTYDHRVKTILEQL